MSEPPGRFLRFFQELKRRNVYKVGVTYLVVAFVVVQVADLTFVRLGLPSWTVTFVIVLVSLGFPIALVLAWAFEMTPEGVRRTPAAEKHGEAVAPPEAGQHGSRSAVKAVVGLGLLAAATAGAWYLMAGGEREVRDRSIAVLPFENMGGEESDQFTRGVHDGLLTRLSHVADLRVISRTSVMQYAETNKTVPQIARELDAAWIVEGAVQQAGGRVRVNAQLIQAPEDAHRWAESYERELNPENLFAIQSELTKKIARSLKARLSPEEAERVERRPTGDLEAYQLYVEGRRLLARRGPEALEKAVQAFQQALDSDSTYALAWAGLGDALGLAEFYEIGVSEAAPRAETAARRALELDPDLAEAHASMGFVHLLDQDGPAALRALQRAVELKPSYAQAQHWLGAVHLLLGRRQPALRHLALAVKLSPHHKTAREWLATAYLAGDQPEKAVREARLARRDTPNEAPPIALLHLGRIGEAREVAHEALATSLGAGWEDPHQRAALAIASVAVGDSAQARTQLARLGDEAAGPFARGVVHAALGEGEAALAAFESVEDWGITGSYSMMTLKYFYPEILGSLRETPRYEQLIREINQQWGLNPDGSLPADAEGR